MLPDPFNAPVDVPSGAAVTAPFTLTSMAANSTVRVNTTANAGEPKVLKVSHQVVGKNSAARDRHLVRLESYVVEDSVEQMDKPISFYAVFDVPQAGVTSAQLAGMFEQFIGLLRGGSGDVAYDGDATVLFDRVIGGES